MFFKVIRLRTLIVGAAAALTAAGLIAAVPTRSMGEIPAGGEAYIKWVDFTPTAEILRKALDLDVKSRESEFKLDWIELLSYLAAKYGGDFGRCRESDMSALAGKLNSGVSMDELTSGMKLYKYYLEAYSAVLGGLVGSYRVEVPDGNGRLEWRERYGLKAFSPIAKGFYYNDYDDFGAGRSYGYRRRHLGHDLMGGAGTPIIAIESGVVEEIGWNQYGGWRIGIRSYDTKRYYYYAHLRRNRPFAEGLEKGHTVKAGDVIGYMGRTGYSATENVNNITQTHLHLGLQLIFDESQKDGVNQIWIDMYQITKFLQANKSAAVRDENGEYRRAYGFEESDREE